jgi:hypothetical protein
MSYGDVAYRIDPATLFGASQSQRTRGMVVVLIGAPILFFSVLLLAYCVFALAVTDFRESTDVVAGVGVGLFGLIPFIISLIAVIFGARALKRGARLRELSGLAYGRTDVTLYDLCARAHKTPREMATTLALAERYRAAFRWM